MRLRSNTDVSGKLSRTACVLDAEAHWQQFVAFATFACTVDEVGETAAAWRGRVSPLDAAGEAEVADLLLQRHDGLLQAHVKAKSFAQVVANVPERVRLRPDACRRALRMGAGLSEYLGASRWED